MPNMIKQPARECCLQTRDLYGVTHRFVRSNSCNLNSDALTENAENRKTMDVTKKEEFIIILKVDSFCAGYKIRKLEVLVSFSSLRTIESYLLRIVNDLLSAQ